MEKVTVILKSLSLFRRRSFFRKLKLTNAKVVCKMIQCLKITDAKRFVFAEKAESISFKG